MPFAWFRRCFEEADQLTDGVMAVRGVAKRKLFVDLVAVAASVTDLRQITGLLEVADDLRCRSLGDSHRGRDVSETQRGILSDRLEHVSVVGDEPPPVVVVARSRFQSSAAALDEWLFKRLQEQGEQLSNGHSRQTWSLDLPLAVDLVPVASADADPGQVAGMFEVVDDLRRRPFGDPDGFGDVPQARIRLGGDAGKYVTVVGDQAPLRRTLSGA
jgi:hypothetical protein